MSNTEDPLPVFGSPEFWEFYDRFCESNLVNLVEKPDHPEAVRMHQIMYAAQRSGELKKLCRPDREWKTIHAWLVLKPAQIQRPNGEFGMVVRAGDVLVVQHQWDRDVFITQTPINETHVSGYFLSGFWESMVGLFMPLFDRGTITRCVWIRAEKTLEETIERVNKEADDWSWP